jgi:KipI family sensor histidine kinase inhibitor
LNVSSDIRVLAYGSHATYLEGIPHGGAAFLRREILQLCAQRNVQFRDVVPTSSTLVVTHDVRDGDTIRMLLRDLTRVWTPRPHADHRNESLVLEIPVRYNGHDLHEVAHTCGLSVPEVVAAHSGATYSVEFFGFAPGFAYLRGLPERLQLARRTTPRIRVPAGAVAIATHYSAVYPNASPGGWHLLGVTDLPLWNPQRDPVSLIQPDSIVRFVPV